MQLLITLAGIRHTRHGLPAAQISRLLGISPVSVKHHINQLLPLFAEHGHPLTPTDRRIKKLEQLTTQLRPLSQTPQPTREVTS